LREKFTHARPGLRKGFDNDGQRTTGVTLIAGLLLAGLCAAATQVGFLLRERGATSAPEVDLRRPLHSAVCLFRQKWWTIGYLVAIVAYAFHVAALDLVALSIVQAVLAGGLVLLAVIAERFFGFSIGRRQWLGVCLAAAGLALLALTGEARSGQGSANYSVPAMVAFECALAGIGAALILCWRVPSMRDQRGIYLGLAAGLLFTVTHVAVKAMTGKTDNSMLETLVNPYLLLALAGGVSAFFASARSLQLGPAVPVIAFTSIAGNASAIPAGIVVFGDPLGHDALIVAVRSLAFLLVVGAAALIPAPTRAATHGKRPPDQRKRRPSVSAASRKGTLYKDEHRGDEAGVSPRGPLLRRTGRVPGGLRVVHPRRR
jgi:drug/metabolite transporter (DMT)-like permease